MRGMQYADFTQKDIHCDELVNIVQILICSILNSIC